MRKKTVTEFTMDPLNEELKPGIVSKKLGVTPRVLSDLITVCLGIASIRDEGGKGSRRVLSFQDAGIVKSGKKLRDYGLAPRLVRRCCDDIKEKWSEIFPVEFEFQMTENGDLQRPSISSKKSHFLVATINEKGAFLHYIVTLEGIREELAYQSTLLVVNVTTTVLDFAMECYSAKLAAKKGQK